MSLTKLITHSKTKHAFLLLFPPVPCLQLRATVSDVWAASKGGSQHSQSNDYQGRTAGENTDFFCRDFVYVCTLYLSMCRPLWMSLHEPLCCIMPNPTNSNARLSCWLRRYMDRYTHPMQIDPNAVWMYTFVDRVLLHILMLCVCSM